MNYISLLIKGYNIKNYSSIKMERKRLHKLVMSERGNYTPRISENRNLYTFQIPFQNLTRNPNLLNYANYIRVFVIGVKGRFRLYLSLQCVA
jgi:hypothetical protein